jgi:hypothetical protein
MKRLLECCTEKVPSSHSDSATPRRLRAQSSMHDKGITVPTESHQLYGGKAWILVQPLTKCTLFAGIGIGSITEPIIEYQYGAIL